MANGNKDNTLIWVLALGGAGVGIWFWMSKMREARAEVLPGVMPAQPAQDPFSMVGSWIGGLFAKKPATQAVASAKDFAREVARTQGRSYFKYEGQCYSTSTGKAAYPVAGCK